MSEMTRMFPALAALALSGCAGKDAAHHEDPAAHACEQVGVDGTAVTAGADVATAAAVQIGDTPLSVALVDDGGGVYHGFVAVTADGPEPTLLLSDTEGAVTGLWLDGVEQTLPQPAPNALCPDDIPEHWDLDLTAGTWAVKIGPVAVDPVWLMWISAEGHEDPE